GRGPLARGRRRRGRPLRPRRERRRTRPLQAPGRHQDAGLGQVRGADELPRHRRSPHSRRCAGSPEKL
ncbi:MAG: Transketolase, partial [uncultured Solirubrobacteraceae bacterium]